MNETTSLVILNISLFAQLPYPINPGALSFGSSWNVSIQYPSSRLLWTIAFRNRGSVMLPTAGMRFRLNLTQSNYVHHVLIPVKAVPDLVIMRMPSPASLHVPHLLNWDHPPAFPNEV